MSRRNFSPRAILLPTVMAALLGVVVYAVQREIGSRSALATASATAQLPVRDDGRRALTAEEEAYAAALWPLHSEVKLAAVRMSFAGIAYKTEDHDPSQFVAKVRPLGGTLDSVAATVRSLDPPPSLRPVHDRYVAALSLYRAASAEMLQGVSEVSEERDELLTAAQEKSFRASEDLLRVSDVLWPGEYRPH
jgi:hypothetical protein